jgi:Asp-tRNA(Asn)/Glu-tRNA(Gln) amidotransferase A subunit family amidase
VTTAPPGALTLAASIRAGRVSALDTLHAHLERVRGTGLNAVVTLDPGAEHAARLADRAVAAGEPLGPLHGVPFTVKDTIDVAGLPSTAGSRALAGRVADRTAPAVDRLRAAGAIVLGKTNCSEFAVDIHTANPLYGATLNPVDRSRTAGGSSGGDAAAVAAGLAAFGLGTDFGGSLRWPAHCTGVCTVRTTPGLVPGAGVLPHTGGPPNLSLMLHRLMTVGPLARTVADLVALLRVLAGPDPVSGTVPSGGAAAFGDPEAVDPSRLRVAWCDGEGSVPVAAEVVDAVRVAAEALRPHVGNVERARPPGLEECADLFVALRDSEGLPEVGALVAGREGLLGAGLARYLADAPTADPSDTARLAARRDAIRGDVLGFLAERPVLLLPVASVPAPPPVPEVVVDGHPVAFARLGSSCRAISVLGLPAAVVPVGRSVDGLPIGVQIVGRPFHDHEVLTVAALLEHVGAPRVARCQFR